jgi:hypothetical protein
MKKCTKCLLVKDTTEFSESKSEKGYKQYHCKVCNKEYRKLRKEESKDYQLKRKFGISLELYNELLKEQEYSCKICKLECKSGRSLAVDHDHKTGEVRGLLCMCCNRALGLFKDDVFFLEESIKYLQTRRKYGTM